MTGYKYQCNGDGKSLAQAVVLDDFCLSTRPCCLLAADGYCPVRLLIGGGPVWTAAGGCTSPPNASVKCQAIVTCHNDIGFSRCRYLFLLCALLFGVQRVICID